MQYTPPSQPMHRPRASWLLRIGLPMAALLAVVLISCIGYLWVQPGLSWDDALYLTVITISTVGMKEADFTLTQAGRLWTIGVIVAGLVTMAVVGTQLAAFVVEAQLRDVFGRRQVEKKINATSNHVILAGYGRMGCLIAQELHQAGRDVVVVEIAPDRLIAAERAGLLCVAGDAQDEAVLETAGLLRANVLVCALPNDAANLFVTLSARQDNPTIQIIARAQESNTESKLRRAGANRVICPHIIGATRMADVVLRPAMVDFVEMAHGGVDLEMDALTVRPDSKLLGQTLQELNLPRRIGAQVVAVRRSDGTTNYHPSHDMTLNVGDRLILVGRAGVAKAFENLSPDSTA